MIVYSKKIKFLNRLKTSYETIKNGNEFIVYFKMGRKYLCRIHKLLYIKILL